MRDDIYTNVDDKKILDLVALLGKGMGRGLFFNCHDRYRFFKGARNTKKSKDIIGYEVILKILTNDFRNIVVLRQNDVDNRQTTFENIKGCIYDLGIEQYFSITTSPLRITYKPTGQQIIFKGMNNPTSINSLTFSHGYLSDVYIEEAYEVQSYDDFVKIDGSIRGKTKDITQQITCCFNAWNKGHWIYDLFFREQTGFEENIYVGDTEQEVFVKGSNDLIAYEKMIEFGKDKYGEIAIRLKNALIVATKEKLDLGLALGTYKKKRRKIIYGMEDDFAFLDRNDVSYDYYDNPHFVGRYGKGLFLHTSTYKINEFRDVENYDVAMVNMKDTFLDGYKVEALGMWGNSSGATYPCFSEDKCFIDLGVATGKNIPFHYENNDSGELVKVLGKEYERYKYLSYAIGIDTGFSNGQGQKRTVKRGEDVLKRVRSATTMCLVGITQLSVNEIGGVRDNKIVVLHEFFHSNDKAFYGFNTDNDINYKDPVELAHKLCETIREWIYIYFNGSTFINCYVDNADIGFRQVMELESQRMGMHNMLSFSGSNKLPIQSRVDFSNELMAYGNFKIVKENCPNLIREIKNSRRGEKGEAREDTDDHEINACEYAWASLKGDIESWKTFKIR